jgi:hypothetical protein
VEAPNAIIKLMLKSLSQPWMERKPPENTKKDADQDLLQNPVTEVKEGKSKSFLLQFRILLGKSLKIKSIC